ncbi:unnamed protein product [Schistocephalus solidus]|uniref:Serine/threonine-protein kinase 1 n=1 Tax=Schistocephalus solidus TaxID=70667 RepID=A0A183SN13_SCHSO|nr:unnamed protein product [Schistocephalus solidus]
MVKWGCRLSIRFLHGIADLTIYQGREEFVGRYDRGDKLGGGGFGSVFRGSRLEDGSDVVIKEVNTNKVPCWCALDGVLVPIEVVLLQMCQHVHGVVRMVDVFNLGDTWVIVMNGISNSVCDMFDYICERGTLSEPEAAFFLYQLIGILFQCHKAGVLHRDIKDENLLIDRNTNELTLIDFGSGAFLHNELYTDFDGTRVYCPPEWIIHSQYYGKPAEVWSIGVLLYDMLCGDVPFVNDKGIISGRLKYRREGLCEEAKHLIGACMNRDAHQRPTLVEILRHPWMQMHRPRSDVTLPLSVRVALDALVYSETPSVASATIPALAATAMPTLPCPRSIRSGLCNITSVPIDVPPSRASSVRQNCAVFVSSSSSSPSPPSMLEPPTSPSPYSFLTAKRPSSEQRLSCCSGPALDLSLAHRVPPITTDSRNYCAFHEPQENVQLQPIGTSCCDQLDPLPRIPSNRSYASSGYFSRSNSLSSDEGMKRLGAVSVAISAGRPTTQPVWATCAILDVDQGWRGKLAARDSSSTTSSSSLSTSANSEFHHQSCSQTSEAQPFTQPVNSPAFRPPGGTSRPLVSYAPFSSVSCSNLLALRYSTSNGSRQFPSVDVDHRTLSAAPLELPDTSLWLRCLDVLGTRDSPPTQRTACDRTEFAIGKNRIGMAASKAPCSLRTALTPEMSIFYQRPVLTGFYQSKDPS